MTSSPEVPTITSFSGVPSIVQVRDTGVLGWKVGAEIGTGAAEELDRPNPVCEEHPDRETAAKATADASGADRESIVAV